MNPPLSESELRSLCYLWEEKDDVERCVCWKEWQPRLAEHHPEILQAWNSYKAARTTVTAVLRFARDRAGSTVKAEPQ